MTRLRRAARVTRAELDSALRGLLRQPGVRNRLWGALGHVPADHGIQLLKNGKQDPPKLAEAKETLNDMEAAQ